MKRRCLSLFALVKRTAFLLCLVALFTSCSDSKLPTDSLEINSQQDWLSFVSKYNQGNHDNNPLKIFVNTSLDFSEGTEYQLGSDTVAFTGEIDFQGHSVIYGDCLIKNADDLTIANLHLFQRENSGVYGTLVKKCSNLIVFDNIVINSAQDNFPNGSILFSSSMLLQKGYRVKINNMTVYDAFVSHYDNLGGLIGECNQLEIHHLKMNSVTVQSLNGYLVTDAGLIARSVKELSLEDGNFARSTVSALHYASGCVVECEKMEISNVSYKDCYINTFPTMTLPGHSSGLVIRNLTEFSQKELSFDNVMLNAPYAGYVTADPQNEFYSFSDFESGKASVDPQE